MVCAYPGHLAGYGYPDRLLDSGSLSNHGIPFNSNPGEKNRLTFFTQTEDSAHRLLLNGVLVPIPFDTVLRQGPYEKYRFGRLYYVQGHDGDERDGGLVYENLCTVRSWR